MEAATGKLTAQTNFPAGYDEEICYICTINPVGGATSIQKSVDNLKIKQEPADCSDSL